MRPISLPPRCPPARMFVPRDGNSIWVGSSAVTCVSELILQLPYSCAKASGRHDLRPQFIRSRPAQSGKCGPAAGEEEQDGADGPTNLGTVALAPGGIGGDEPVSLDADIAEDPPRSRAPLGSDF